MCVLLITRCCREWEGGPVNQVNYTSWVAVVTPTDRPKSVRNCCLIELFCRVVCVVTLPFWHFCWCRGFCHRTGSDLPLFVNYVKVLTLNGLCFVFIFLYQYRSIIFKVIVDWSVCDHFVILWIDYMFFLSISITYKNLEAMMTIKG